MSKQCKWCGRGGQSLAQSKRKDYLKLFVNYARKNVIGYDVYAMGSVRCLYFAKGGRVIAPILTMFGSKAAYLWLVKAHREAQDDTRA